tara:strand:- start:649 stop:825 length:177 start_codon:yes stop_codon:yes gene_type:complete
MTLSKNEIDAIISIAQKIILEQEKSNNEVLRKTEDKLDHDDVNISDVQGPQNCDSCAD